MDSGAISQLVFFVFGAAVFIYGFIVYRDLSRLRDANDRARAKLDSLIRAKNEGSNSAVVQGRISAAIQSFDQDVSEFNTRIGGFPESIVAAIMGLKRREKFRGPSGVSSKTTQG